MQKITYASLGALGEDFHHAFENALKHVEEKLGRTYPLFIKGSQKKARNGTFEDVCPFDTRRVLGKFQLANREETRQAISAAKAAFSESAHCISAQSSRINDRTPVSAGGVAVV
jgi:hypothetical protein